MNARDVLGRSAVLRRRPVRWVGATLVAALVVPALGGWHRGFDSTVVAMSPGSVWLVSADRGELTLLDATTPSVVRHLPLAAAGDTLAVRQGGTAFGVNGATGALTRIDGRTFSAATEPGVLARASTRPSIAATAGDLYVVDGDGGLVTRVDTATLHPAGRFDLRMRPPEGGTAVDEAGRVWMTDSVTRDVAWLVDGVAGRSAGVAAAPGAVVAPTERGPVLVVPAAGRAQQLDADGAVTTTVPLPLRADDRIAVAGGGADVVDVAVGSRGLLVHCALGSGDGCLDPIPLGTAADELGRPAAQDGLVFVPDHDTGRVLVVDPARHRVVAEAQALTHPGAVELLAQDGVVVFNDPQGPEAGVVDADGAVRRVDKAGRTAADARADPASAPAAGPGAPASRRPATVAPRAPASTPPAPVARTTAAVPTTPPMPPPGSPAPVVVPTSPAGTANPPGARPTVPATAGRAGPELAPTKVATSQPVAPTTALSAPPTTSGGAPAKGNKEPTQVRNDHFDRGASGWRSDTVAGGEYGPLASAFRVRSLVPGFAVWAPAPVSRLPGAIRITAKARLSPDDQGGWGIWATAPGWTDRRYEFSLDQTGFAYLKEPGSDVPVGFDIDPLDPYVEHTMVAELRPVGDQVLMRLTVDGRFIVERSVQDESVAGGTVGLHAFSYSDPGLAGRPLGDARFSSFVLERL